MFSHSERFQTLLFCYFKNPPCGYLWIIWSRSLQSNFLDWLLPDLLNVRFSAKPHFHFCWLYSCSLARVYVTIKEYIIVFTIASPFLTLIKQFWVQVQLIDSVLWLYLRLDKVLITSHLHNYILKFFPWWQCLSGFNLYNCFLILLFSNSRFIAFWPFLQGLIKSDVESFYFILNINFYF